MQFILLLAKNLIFFVKQKSKATADGVPGFISAPYKIHEKTLSILLAVWIDGTAKEEITVHR